jgi:hypothetical protein
MTTSKYSLRILLCIVLVVSSLLIIGCEGSYISVYIENLSSDNFRLGGPNGPHISPGEQKFLCSLYQKKSGEQLSYSVELWRSYGCVVVLSVTGIIGGESPPFDSALVTIIDHGDPPFLATVNHPAVGASTAHCP